MQPCPSRLITTHPEHSLQAQRAGSVLLARHVPHCPEPHLQRLPRILENGSRSGRSLVIALAALPQGGTYRPRLAVPAAGTPKTFRPTQLQQILPTRLLRREPRLELLYRPRIVVHGTMLLIGAT